MAKDHDVQLPVELLTKLSRLHSQVRRLAFLRGSGLFVASIALLLAAGMLVDLQWELATSVRVGILLGFAGITAAVAWMWVIRPLSLRLQAAELAAVVERAHPELLERLTSTVEFNDPNLPEAFKGSPYMRQLLLRQTVKRSAEIDFSGSVSSRRAMRWLCIGAFTVVLLASPFMWSPSAYGLMWSRFFQPWGNHDRVAGFLFDVENGNRVVARGSDVKLSVKIEWRGTDGERPETVRMNWRDATGATDSRRLKYDAKADAYTAVIAHVFNGFDYNISAADNRSRQYHIQVVEAPEIAEITLDIASPSYTGIPAVHNDGVVGTIAVVEQSKLTFHLKFNKPITASELRWLDMLSSVETETGQDATNTDEGVKYEPMTALRLATDGKSAELRLTATIGGPFDFLLTDKHGLNNSDEPERILEVIPDRPPVLTLAGSSRFSQARPDDVVNIQASVVDDFGVDALELYYRIEQGGPHIIAVPATKLGVLSIAHQFDLDLESLQLAHGTTVTLRVRAADQREVPGPNEVWSEPRVLLIDRSAKPLGSDVVADRQQKLRQQLQQIQADLKQNHAKLAEINTEAAADIRMQLQFDRDKELAPLADRQADLAERLEELASEFAEHPLYSNLTTATRKVARIPLTDAARGTRQSAVKPLKEKADTLGKVDDTLAQAEADLAAIEKKFDELAKIETELLEINRLAQQFEKKAKELAEQARNQLQQQQQPPANESPAQAEQREQQVAQQQEMLKQSEQDLAELAKKLEELFKQQPELAEAARQQELDRLAELSRKALELAEPQDLLADALREESKAAADEFAPLAKKQEEILREAEKLAAKAEADPNKGPATPLDPGALREALDELRKGNLNDAVERQEEAANELDRLAAELKKNDQLPADPQKAVEELARRQRELEKKIAQAAKDEPKDATTPAAKEQQERKLRPLAAEQAALQAEIARQQLPQKNREQQQQTVNKAAESVNKLLRADPQTAAEAAANTAANLEQLAQQIGTEAERNEQAKREVAQLRKEQQEIRQAVAKATEKQKTAKNADQAKAELQPLAKKQEQIARKLAEIDAPTAGQEQREALRKATRATADLEKVREQDANTSQAQTEQAIARLQKKLANQPLPEQTVAKLQKQQQQLNRDAGVAQKKSDKNVLARKAQQQRQIAAELAKIDVPAARDEQQAARNAAEAAVQKLAQAENIEEEVADALKRVDEALQKLEQAIDPNQQHRDAAKQAEQLAKRQQNKANNTRQAAEGKETPTAQQREQVKNDLADVARQAERLRAGDVAQQEKRDALETLQKAADAQQKVDELAQQQEQLVKNGDPKPNSAGDPKDPNNTPLTPDELQDELQRLRKEEAQAQQQAADALQQFSKKLAGNDATKQQEQQQRQENQQAEQLAQPNNQSAEQLAKAAETLADKQAELRKQAEQLAGEKNTEKRAEAAKQLAQKQDELRKQTEQLPSQQAALQRGDAANKMEQASRSLQQDEAPQAAAEQQQAEQALRDVAQRARAAAQAENKPMNQPADQQQTAERAADLAQQQRDLEQRVSQLQQERATAQQNQVAANNADPQNPEAQPQTGQPTPAQQAQAQQRQLAQQAAELALKTAAETGVVSTATKRAAEFARQAAEAAKQASAGQLRQAKNDAAQAANSGEEAAKQLAADGSPQAPQLRDQAQKLAQQQKQLGEQFGEMAQSTVSRAQAQQAGQQQLRAATKRLAQELAESAQRLNAQPVGLNQQAQQAQGAEQAAQQATQAMQQAQQQLAQGNNADAAQAAEQAADALRKAAEQAAGPPMMVNGEKSPSPVPGSVGDQVAEANRRLEQARQQLADAQAQQQSGQPQPGEAGQPGEQPVEQGQPGKPGQRQTPLGQSAQNLQQAADALAQAAKQLQQPGQQGQSGQPGGQKSQQVSQDPSDDPSELADGGEGKGARATLDLTRLEIELKNLAGRDWGRLPGELRTEIMQGAKKQSNSDYARLIKLYFREIAKPQTGAPVRGTKP